METVPGGTYTTHVGGEGSLISVPLLDHGAFDSVDNASSPTGAADYPLPIDW